MTDYPIRVTPAGYQVGATTDGRDFAAIGPPHETPRAAIDYSDALQKRATDERARVAAPAALGVALDAIPAPSVNAPARRSSTGPAPLVAGLAGMERRAGALTARRP